MMKFIIHDWDNDRALKILKNIYQFLPLTAGSCSLKWWFRQVTSRTSARFRIEMLMSLGGAERTPDEYRDLLAQAGFELRAIIPTKSPLSIVEAFKSGAAR